MKGVPLESAITEGKRGLGYALRDDLEQHYLLEGLLRCWAEERYPSLRDEYEFSLVEQEFRWTMGEPEGVKIIDLLRLDGLLRRRSDGEWFYLEFKSAASIDEAWIQGWEQNAQFLLNIAATESLLGIRVHGVIIEGLEKGRREPARGGGPDIQHSPLCYGWARVDGEGKRQIRTSYAPGHSRIGWWQAGRTPREVVDLLGPEGRRAVLASVPPIRPRSDLLRDHLEQALAQELRVYRGRAEVDQAPDSAARRSALNVHFPQNPAHCRRYKRRPCAYLEACYDEEIGSSPVESGFYTTRSPNHPEGAEGA